jgi:hypothetical protein
MQELSNWLGRVEAPPELWERVRKAGVARALMPAASALMPMLGAPERSVETSLDAAGRSARATFWPALAIAAAVVLAALLLPRDLHSGDPAHVKAWVLSKTGIDVPLPAKLGPAVRLVSASRPDKSTARLAYQVNGRDAVLLVSMASAAVAGDGRHRLLSRSANTSSWTMRGLVYTVVCPSAEVSQVACQLCHSL